MNAHIKSHFGPCSSENRVNIAESYCATLASEHKTFKLLLRHYSLYLLLFHGEDNMNVSTCNGRLHTGTLRA